MEKYIILWMIMIKKENEKMEYRYRPEGVCSREIIIEIENNIIKNLKIVGGCPRKYSRSFKISTK